METLILDLSTIYRRLINDISNTILDRGRVDAGKKSFRQNFRYKIEAFDNIPFRGVNYYF